MIKLSDFEGLSNPEAKYNQFLCWAAFMSLGFGSLSFKLAGGELLSSYQINELFQ